MKYRSQMMLLKIRRRFGEDKFKMHDAAHLFTGIEFNAEWFLTQVRNGYIRKHKDGFYSNKNMDQIPYS